jgi:soluble lytic murein transglycosylase
MRWSRLEGSLEGKARDARAHGDSAAEADAVDTNTADESPSDQELVLFQRAYCLQQLQRWEEAAGLYRRLLDRGFPLEDYVRLFLAVCLDGSGRFEDAAAQLRRLSDSQESLLGLEAQQLLGNVLLRWGRPQEASDLFGTLIQDPRTKGNRSALTYDLARAHLALERNDLAVTTLSGLMADAPSSQEAFQALQELPSLRPGPLTDRELFQSGCVNFHRGRYQEAARAWDLFVERTPDDPRAPEALFLSARASHRAGTYRRAQERCRLILSLYPQSQQITSASYLLARCFEGLGQSEEAIRQYREFITVYPWSQLADDALWRVAGIYERRHDLEAAEREYWELSQRYASRRGVGLAIWRAALYAYLRGDDETALVRLNKLLRRSSGGTLPLGAMYWSARVHQRAGRREQAEKLLVNLTRRDSDGYYGEKARALLGSQRPGSTIRRLSIGDIMATSRTAVDCLPAESANRRRFEKGTLLLRLGLLRRARQELSVIHQLAGRHPEILSELLQLYNQYHLYGDALRLAQSARSHLEEPLLEETLENYLYPLGYQETVAAEARASGLDPHLVLSLMRVESMFDPLAVSPAGARGLMQVMPATGNEIAQQLGIPPGEVPSPFSPQWSIRMGTYYLGQQLMTFGGHTELALAAYNAGPGNVMRWQRQFQGADPELFVELIGFRETRLYVRKVLTAHARYRRLWGEGS